MRLSFLKLSFLATLPLCVAAAAHADTVTDIAFTTPSVWDGGFFIGGSQIAAAPKNGNTGTGITFADWHGTLLQTKGGATNSFAIADVALTSQSTVNALLQNVLGDSQQDAIVTFANSTGQTAIYSLVGCDTTRSYQNPCNPLTGGSLAGGVTAQNWWNDVVPGQNKDNQFLDVQTFYLPASWGGTDLTSFSITATSPVDEELSAMQVDAKSAAAGTAVTPEPSSLVLLGTGALGMAGAVRRRFRKA